MKTQIHSNVVFEARNFLTGCACRDRYRDASHSSILCCFVMTSIIALSLFSGYQTPVMMAVSEINATVSIEYIDEANTAPQNTISEEQLSQPVVEESIEEILEEPEEVVEEIQPEEIPIVAEKPKKEPEKKHKPIKKTPQKASATPPSVPTDGVGNYTKAGNPGNSEQFISRFISLVERNKYYPKNARRAGLTGIVKVRVSFDSAGNIVSASLLPGDYHVSLGSAALSTIEKVKKSWRPPSSGPNSLTIPISFQLK